MNNGMQLVLNGTASCDIETPLESEASCESGTKAAFVQVKSLGIREKFNLPIPFREKGVPFTSIVKDISKTFNFGLNPQF